MQRFQFRLESIRKWKLAKVELEEAKLQGLFGQLRLIEGKIADLDRQRADNDRQILSGASASAQDLAALDAYHRFCVVESARFKRQIAVCEQQIVEQRARVRDAHRDVDLLDRLKTKQKAEWQAENDREQEALASEVFLAKWRR
jgi:flagellar export protein FliJ